jgi:hypothetical protein
MKVIKIIDHEANMRLTVQVNNQLWVVFKDDGKARCSLVNGSPKTGLIHYFEGEDARRFYEFLDRVLTPAGYGSDQEVVVFESTVAKEFAEV